jgi:hypothetical protein
LAGGVLCGPVAGSDRAVDHGIELMCAKPRVDGAIIGKVQFGMGRGKHLVVSREVFQ